MLSCRLLAASLLAVTLIFPVGTRVDEKTGVTFRLFEKAAAEGLFEVFPPDTDEKIYLHAKPLATAKDVVSVTFSRDASDLLVVTLEFKAQAAKRLAAKRLAAKRLVVATKLHLDKKIVSSLNGKIVMATTVQGVISRRARLNGQFTDTQMRRMFDALVLPKK